MIQNIRAKFTDESDADVPRYFGKGVLDRSEWLLLDAVMKLIPIESPLELGERTLRFILDEQWQIPGDPGAGCHPQEIHGCFLLPRIQNRIQPGLEPFWVSVTKQFLQFVGEHVDQGPGAGRKIMPLCRIHFARF